MFWQLLKLIRLSRESLTHKLLKSREQVRLRLISPPKLWILSLLPISAALRIKRSQTPGKEQKPSISTCFARDSFTRKITTEPWRPRCDSSNTRKSFKQKTFTVLSLLHPSLTRASENAAELLLNLSDSIPLPSRKEKRTSYWQSTSSRETHHMTSRRLNSIVLSAAVFLTNSK